MKYIIYLSVILIVLSGCKGNAFMKQRYTNFSNTQHKNGNKTTPAKTKPQQEGIAVVTTPQSREITNADSYAGINQEQAVTPFIAGNSVSHRIPSTHENSFTEKKGIQKYTSQAGQHFKKINENEKKRGVIGLILEIILSIIILAIVVAVVILVVLV